MNRHDLLIKTRSTFPPSSLPPPPFTPFVVTAVGLVSYACWSCSFVKGRCYNLCDLPLCCLLWQSRDGRKCLEYFWQEKKKKSNHIPGPRKDSAEDAGIALHWREERQITHSSAPTPKAKTIFISTQGFYKSPKSLLLKIYYKTAIKVSEWGKSLLL